MQKLFIIGDWIGRTGEANIEERSTHYTTETGDSVEKRVTINSNQEI